MGMESGFIPNEALTASSRSDQANHGRISSRNDTTAWYPHSSTSGQWFQIDFGVKSNVTGIATQGKDSKWVKYYMLGYFMYGKDVQMYTKSGNIMVSL